MTSKKKEKKKTGTVKIEIGDRIFKQDNKNLRNRSIINHQSPIEKCRNHIKNCSRAGWRGEGKGRKFRVAVGEMEGIYIFQMG